MLLTKEFKETVRARVNRDPAFRLAMLTETVNEFLVGDVEIAKRILRDYIKAFTSE